MTQSKKAKSPSRTKASKPNSNQNQKNAANGNKRSWVAASLKVLWRSFLLLMLIAVLQMVFNRHTPNSLLQYTIGLVERPTNYVKLMQMPEPTENSLPNPLPGQHLADTWGAARSNGRSHEGIDIFAERNTPVLSTTQGIVKRVGTNNLGGNVVVVLGPGRQGHYYAHLESYGDIEVGDWVEAGDVIGYVGNSGNAKTTPPHLHYGIYTMNGAINPYPLLEK